MSSLIHYRSVLSHTCHQAPAQRSAWHLRPRVHSHKQAGPESRPSLSSRALLHSSSCRLRSRTCALPETALMLADISPKTAGTIALIVQPTLALSIFLMLVRIILSWYPNVKLNKFPYSVAVAPTEPFLGPTRRAVPPIGGVDVAPIIWLAIFSFVNEILLGPQGILNLLQRQIEF